MRRLVPFYVAPVVALAALLTTGCEDGPNQTYSPAPNGAGGIWNGPPGSGGLGDGGAYVPTGTQEFDAGSSGTSLNVLCTADEEKAVWSNLFQQGIYAPGIAGGIDVAGGYSTGPEGHCTSDCVGSAGYTPGQPYTYDGSKESWTGITVEQAEAILCQATATAPYYGETNSVGWGESLEFNAEYVVASRQITDLLIENGYTGSLTATATTTNGGNKVGDKYVMSMQSVPMTKNGQPMTIDWDTSDPAFVAQINGFYNALLDTFQPAFPRDTNCIATGNCQVPVLAGEESIMYYPALNLILYFGPPNAAQPAPSIVDLVDLGLLKLLPFATSSNLLKLDSVGPTATQANIASSGNTCVYQLGMQFSDFNSSCVESHTTATDPTAAADNATEEAKLFGGMTHSDEAYQFDIAGIDPQFVASSLASNAVVKDGQQPAATDVAYQYELDTADLGNLANDFAGNDATQTKDYHGIGLLTLEWAQTLQKYMQQNYGVNTALGDTACTAAMGNIFDGSGNQSGTFKNPPTKICSGIEGIVTTAPVASAALPINALGPAALDIGSASKLAVGMKPSSWSALVCFDGAGLVAGKPSGYKNCIGGDTSFRGNVAGYWDTITDALTVAYDGNPLFASNPLPQDITNRRFAFQQWIFALVKYLQSAETLGVSLATIDGNFIDPNDLFLDSAGAGFDSAQYVFRNNVVSGNQAPTTLSVTVELNGANMNDYAFTRWNFRGETALYSVLQADPTTGLPRTSDNGKLGAEPLLLSNMVGSSLLTSLFGTNGVTDPTTGPEGYPAAMAAFAAGEITEDLTDYFPAFGQSAFNIAANDAPPTAAPMTVNATDYEFIQSAMVTMPVWSNPYDPTSATKNDAIVNELLPFVASGASVGFSVTIDGSREKFYNTNELVFGGASVNGVLDWEYTTISGTTGQSAVVRAFETQNYTGKVFFCAEPSPTVDGLYDILDITMYQPAQPILNWIAAHPNATSDCGIVIEYSIYGNYADYIESNTYGVRIALNASYGGAVVTDMTIFDPNVISTLGS